MNLKFHVNTVASFGDIKCFKYPELLELLSGNRRIGPRERAGSLINECFRPTVRGINRSATLEELELRSFHHVGLAGSYVYSAQVDSDCVYNRHHLPKCLSVHKTSLTTSFLFFVITFSPVSGSRPLFRLDIFIRLDLAHVMNLVPRTTLRTPLTKSGWCF